MVARRLDDIVEESLQKRELTRRDFLKGMFLLALSIGTGVGFAGCSSPSGFEPSSPQNTGYRLIYPDWTKPVPDDVIPHIIEIGKKYIHVFAPGYLVFGTENGDVWAWAVNENDTLYYFTTTDSRFDWLIGDTVAAGNNYKDIYLKYFGKGLPKFISFVNNNMSTYGAIIIMGKSNDLVIGNFTFIEEGGGKVASCVGTYNFNNPENRQFHAFHDKNKLDKMMIDGVFEGCSYAKLWYLIPDKCYKKQLKDGYWYSIEECFE